MSENGKVKEHRNWLQWVQEQSWEPEILISGIVLFALFQIPPIIKGANEFLDLNSILIFSDGNVDEMMAAILLTANYWLILGFTTHLIGRSIWAAFIGLSYVYVDGIRMDKLKYGERYKKIISRSGNYRELIEKLEKFCSRVFAVSFLLFMCILGVFFFLTVIGLIIALLLEVDPDLETTGPYIDPVLQTIGIIYLFDFVTLGLIKRIPIVNVIYYPFYRMMSFLTLAPLYRSIYYGFVTNHKSWKVGLWMIIFSGITIFAVSSIEQQENFIDIRELKSNGGENYIFPGNYRNLAGEKPSKRLILESDIIESDVARVLIVHGSQYEEKAILDQCNFQAVIDSSGFASDSIKMACLQQFILLQLDGENLEQQFFYTEDRQLERQGLLTYLDLAEVDRGMHELRMFYLLDNDEGIDSLLVSDVEFFKNSLPLVELKRTSQDLPDSLSIEN